MTSPNPATQTSNGERLKTRTPGRDSTIDAMRGLAILAMVAAHMATMILAEPHPLWFRLYGSFAAPLFILMSGMMVALTAESKKNPLHYFAVRGFMVVMVAAFIDLGIHHVYPFLSFDVLYLIGISIPLIFMFVALKGAVRWILIGIIFAAAPFLQSMLGYSPMPTEVFIWENPLTLASHLPHIPRHWVVDGWFPLVPWLGFSFLGVQFAQWRWKEGKHQLGSTASLGVGLVILLLGAVIFGLQMTTLMTRNGYSELFYPPTSGYILTAIGLIIVLFSVMKAVGRVVPLQFLQVLGEASLFMYIIHLAIIQYVLVMFLSLEDLRMTSFMAIYGVLLAVLILIGYAVRHVKRIWTSRPFIARFLLGG